jgi:hypothetical protein
LLLEEFSAKSMDNGQIPKGLNAANHLAAVVSQQIGAHADRDHLLIGADNMNRHIPYRRLRLNGVAEDAVGLADIGPENVKTWPAHRVLA